MSKVNFEGKGGKIAKTKKKNEKGSRKNTFLTISKSILKEKEEKYREKKRKGFEKKFLLTNEGK